MKIGILDIQGSVAEHAKMIERAGAELCFVKTVSDLEGLSGLILPGGESTTIGKLLRRFSLRDEIIRRATAGDLAIYGTCAGAILLAKKLSGKDMADTLGLMDIEIERNSYGRQLESFEGKVEFETDKSGAIVTIPAVFIRAPRIISVMPDVEVLAKYKGDIVAARQGKFLVTTFHPELTDDLFVHRYFLDIAAT